MQKTSFVALFGEVLSCASLQTFQTGGGGNAPNSQLSFDKQIVLKGEITLLAEKFRNIVFEGLPYRYACLYVHMCAGVRVSVYTCVHVVCLYVCLCVFVCACVCVRVLASCLCCESR